jgi:hypothetical protein
MSKTRTSFQQQCKKKIKYATRRKARDAYYELVKIYHNKPPLNFYECPHCAWWHIGRMSPEQIKARKVDHDKNSND